MVSYLKIFLVIEHFHCLWKVFPTTVLHFYDFKKKGDGKLVSCWINLNSRQVLVTLVIFLRHFCQRTEEVAFYLIKLKLYPKLHANNKVSQHVIQTINKDNSQLNSQMRQRNLPQMINYHPFFFLSPTTANKPPPLTKVRQLALFAFNAFRIV